MAQTPLDPLGMWRDLLNHWEQDVNRAANTTMHSTDAARLMNQAMAMHLRFQQGMAEAMTKYLQAIGVPTRSDVLAIGERLAAMEDRLKELAPHAAAAPSALPDPRPPRTKKPTPDATPNPTPGPNPTSNLNPTPGPNPTSDPDPKSGS